MNKEHLNKSIFWLLPSNFLRGNINHHVLTNWRSSFGLLGWRTLHFGFVLRERGRSAGCWGLKKRVVVLLSKASNTRGWFSGD